MKPTEDGALVVIDEHRRLRVAVDVGPMARTERLHGDTIAIRNLVALVG